MVTKAGKKSSKKKGITKRTKGDYQKGRELAVQPKAELKASDLPYTGSQFAVGGTFQYLNNVVNGSEIYQRTGRKIYMKSLHIKGYIYPTIGTGSTDPAFIRMIVLYDAQPNGALPALADVLMDSSAAAATSVVSELNLNNRERFKILREQMWVMGPNNTIQQSAIQDGSQCLVVNEFIKLKKIESIYNATNGGTIADVTSGALIALFLCDTASTTLAWKLAYSARLRYYD